MLRVGVVGLIEYHVPVHEHDRTQRLILARRAQLPRYNQVCEKRLHLRPAQRLRLAQLSGLFSPESQKFPHPLQINLPRRPRQSPTSPDIFHTIEEFHFPNLAQEIQTSIIILT